MTALAQPITDPDADAFAFTLALIEQAFRLARPDARDFALRERNRYLLTAIGFQKRGDHYETRAAYYQDRADAIGEIVERFKSRLLYAYDRGGILPEQRAQPQRRDPILALVEKGALGHDHQRAAEQIAQCYENVCRAVMPKVRDMVLFVPPPKVSGRKFRDLGMSPKAWDLYTEVYLPWAREMHERRDGGYSLALVLDVVVEGRTVKLVARNNQVRWATAMACLKRGLALWGDVAMKKSR